MEDIQYMKLAICLASKAENFEVNSNPKVGAVLVYNNTIIGQGYHIRQGEGHAEVNCITSVPVNLRHLIPQSTMYVTLEPCAHQGRTPSCAKMLVDQKIKKVVVGTLDPFPKVAGKGCEILREGGVDVSVGLLEDQCKAVSKIFMTNQLLKRPYITLKWAESNDGFIDFNRNPNEPAAKISSPYIQLLTHKLRGEHSAILIGKRTALMDQPRLNNRLYPGLPSPKVFVIDSHRESDAIPAPKNEWHLIKGTDDLNQVMSNLYDQGVTSLLVEGGAKIIRSFLEQNLWDTIRREVGTINLGAGVEAPQLSSSLSPSHIDNIDRHQLIYYHNSAV